MSDKLDAIKSARSGADQAQVWHTPADVARFLGVSDQHIRNEIECGRIAAIRVGKHFRICRDEYYRYRNALLMATGCGM